MIHKVIRWSIIAAVVAILGFGVYHFFFKKKGENEAALEEGEAAKDALIDGLAKK